MSIIGMLKNFPFLAYLALIDLVLVAISTVIVEGLLAKLLNVLFHALPSICLIYCLLVKKKMVLFIFAWAMVDSIASAMNTDILFMTLALVHMAEVVDVGILLALSIAVRSFYVVYGVCIGCHLVKNRHLLFPRPDHQHDVEHGVDVDPRISILSAANFHVPNTPTNAS